MTNEIWSKVSQDDYNKILEAKNKEYNRHDDFDNYIHIISFYARVRDFDRKLDGTPEVKAPETTCVKSYKLTFGKNKNLAFTESTKVVSGHQHHNGKRVTLLYQGLGAFTFQLKDALSLLNRSLWQGKYQSDQTFNCQLQFNRNGQRVEGSGKTDTDADVHIEVRLEPQDKAHWIGYYEQGD